MKELMDMKKYFSNPLKKNEYFDLKKIRKERNLIFKPENYEIVTIFCEIMNKYIFNLYWSTKYIVNFKNGVSSSYR